MLRFIAQCIKLKKISGKITLICKRFSDYHPSSGNRKNILALTRQAPWYSILTLNIMLCGQIFFRYIKTAGFNHCLRYLTGTGALR